MFKKCLASLGLVAVLILSGCGAAPTPAIDTGATVQAAVNATLTAQPTNTATPEPTDTPVPTNTPTPTETPVPTNTPIPPTNTPTETPTKEPTNTPTPTPVPTDTPTSIPPTNTPLPAPTNTPIPPTSTPAPLPASAEIGVDKSVGAWGTKLYDVKRAKAVWFFGDGTYAQGVWLIPFVEFKNNSGGTSAPGDDLTFYFVDDQGRRFDFDVFNSNGILGAAHQFTSGHYYDPIDPGLVLGISLPIDTPMELGAVWLKVEEDPNFSIYLGKASDIPLVDK